MESKDQINPMELVSIYDNLNGLRMGSALGLLTSHAYIAMRVFELVQLSCVGLLRSYEFTDQYLSQAMYKIAHSRRIWHNSINII